MGQFYLRNHIDTRWFGLDEYFEITFHYDFGLHADPKEYDNFLAAKEWPYLRKWIRDDCEGDVIVQVDGNHYGRKWAILLFEYESDLMAFKLKWL